MNQQQNQPEDANWNPDLLSKLGHRLIREVCADGSDPFFVAGHPSMAETETRLIRACFYYALVVSPKVTMLLSNFDRGGMCDMIPEEIVGMWRTSDLCAAYGVSFEGLRAGAGELTDAPMPENVWTFEDSKMMADAAA